MKHFIQLCLFIFVACLGLRAQTKVVAEEQLQFGDLLFVVTSGDNAIVEVTKGIDGLRVEHVAAYIPAKGLHAQACVIEATPELGVASSDLPSFVGINSGAECEARILVMRVVGEWNREGLLEVFSSLRGRPYDYLFDSSDDALYCSELIQKGYFDSKGDPIFERIPMEFRNEEGDIPQYWIALFAENGLEVPEGALGTNPGQISRSTRLEVIGWLE